MVIFEQMELKREILDGKEPVNDNFKSYLSARLHKDHSQSCEEH